MTMSLAEELDPLTDQMRLWPLAAWRFSAWMRPRLCKLCLGWKSVKSVFWIGFGCQPDLVRQLMQSITFETVVRPVAEPSGNLKCGHASGVLSTIWPDASGQSFLDGIVAVMLGEPSRRVACELFRANGETFDAEITTIRSTSPRDVVRLAMPFATCLQSARPLMN